MKTYQKEFELQMFETLDDEVQIEGRLVSTISELVEHEIFVKSIWIFDETGCVEINPQTHPKLCELIVDLYREEIIERTYE